jgi:hypothetical protein
MGEVTTSKLWLLCVLYMMSGWILICDQWRWWYILKFAALYWRIVYSICFLSMSFVWLHQWLQEASYYAHSLSCCVTTMRESNFLLCLFFELLCHFYEWEFIKQTMYALCSLYDKWMDFNMRPMEMMMHSELCCSLLVKSIFCLPCIHVLTVIISMLLIILNPWVVLSLLWGKVEQANYDCFVFFEWQVDEYANHWQKRLNSICLASMSFVWLCPLFWLYSHCYQRKFSEQAITATCSWHDKWVIFNIHPV